VKEQKSVVRQFMPAVLMAAIYIALLAFSPVAGKQVLSVSMSYFKEMVLIVPAVAVLMGLFDVWVPKHLIEKYLGSGSGIKGIVLAIVFGTAPTGPLYVAFPIAAGLIKKGARLSNVVIFLGTWAALKIPQIAVEIRFLGLGFSVARFALTLVAVILTGFILEHVFASAPEVNRRRDPNEIV